MRSWTKRKRGSRRQRSTDFAGAVVQCVSLLAIFFCCWLATPETGALRLKSASAKGSLVPEEAGKLYKSKKVAVYVVKKGDRLTDLARRFYGDPEKTWIIEEANDLLPLEPGQVLVIPLLPSNPGGLSADGYQVVSIITYHHFSEKCTNALCMPVEEFARQMAMLAEEGYRTVTMKEVLRFVNYQQPLPRKAVAITIDDGYRSVYELAYPILRRHNFKATLFIYTDFIDNSPNALSWEQLRELAEAGFEVESHTITHADLTLKRKGESRAEYLKRIRHELRLPRELIRKHVGQEAVWLAYPYGRWNKLVIAMAREEGYQGGVTVTRGAIPFFVDPFKVGRNQVMNPVKGHAFEQLVKYFRGEVLQ
jgi:peptidoglycan/xylan/chitin deacetylase (PgdA/CDA1 family)